MVKIPSISDPAKRKRFQEALNSQNRAGLSGSAGRTSEPNTFGIPVDGNTADRLKLNCNVKVTQKRLRQSTKPLLNKLETAFLGVLVGQYGEKNVFPQAITFKLANGLRYTPDFVAFSGSVGAAMYCFETKGHMRDDAAAKIKMAASVYPHIEWTLVWRDKTKDWQMQRILS